MVNNPVPIWILIGLMIASIVVSALGALFSVLGLRDLFAGAPLSVMAMGAGLEFGKFVLAAFLHERWMQTKFFMKSYMVFAVVTLSLITSMGIFGYLSNAYQTSAVQLEAEQLKIASLKDRQKRIEDEISRVNATVAEIPDSRISKKLAARKEAEPRILALNEQNNQILDELATLNQSILKVQAKVGPLIYVARMFGKDIDTVVKYLIIVFVSVFDPLAICCVIALTASLKSRRLSHQSLGDEDKNAIARQQTILSNSKRTSETHVALKAEVPRAEMPRAEEPKAEMPKSDMPKSDSRITAPSASQSLAMETSDEDEPIVEMQYVEDPKLPEGSDEDRKTS